MIKASELRIGNRVNFLYPEEDSAGNMVGHSDLRTIDSGADIQHVTDFPDSYDAVILNTELLEKCGFGIHANGLWVNNDVWLENNPHGKFITPVHSDGSSYRRYIGKHLDFVHQLQNLYFALTGEELEVKL